MIAKVVRGWQPGGLVRYLFGPGRFEEHRDPRVVASWDGVPGLHQPQPLAAVVLGGERVEPGEFDLDLRHLIRTMAAPAELARLPVRGLPALPPEWARALREGRPLPADVPPWVRHYRRDPTSGRMVREQGYVWHCSVRLHPDDPTLTDAQWSNVAQRLTTAVGIHQARCRWIAVRHADDHIHLMATLVDHETGRRFHPYRDFPKLRAACQQLERELGLVGTAAIDRTAAPAPTRAELGKAARMGRTCTAREQLRSVVRRCAATSHNGADFIRALDREGVKPVARLDDAGEVGGFTVGLPGDRSATGGPIRFAGSTLAPDLSWPKLQARWATTPPNPGPPARTEWGRVPIEVRAETLRAAASTVNTAAEAVRERREGVEALAHAAGEVLTALGDGREGPRPGPVSAVAERYDRAARAPFRVVPSQAGIVAQELRLAARQIGGLGTLSGRGDERLAVVALLLALGSLVAEVAAWQQEHRRPHQAAAARAAATALPGLADAVGRPPAKRALRAERSIGTRPEPSNDLTPQQPASTLRVTMPPTGPARRR